VDRYRKENEALESKRHRLEADYADLQATFSSMAAQQTASQAKGKIEVRIRDRSQPHTLLIPK
jgi:hypothetical protein